MSPAVVVLIVWLATMAVIFTATCVVIAINMALKTRIERVDVVMKLVVFFADGGVDEVMAEQLVVSLTGMPQGAARVMVATAYKMRKEETE